MMLRSERESTAAARAIRRSEVHTAAQNDYFARVRRGDTESGPGERA
jgi:hypothetical protein